MSTAIIQEPDFQEKWSTYPEHVRPYMDQLRSCVHLAIERSNVTSKVIETLKWGEPSFVTKSGSTFRMDWKDKSPDTYAVYFNCNTSLVATFKVVFGSLFTYEKNRGLNFKIGEELPTKEITQCFIKALTYHQVKDLPLLEM